jgi:hypothetical protein
LIQSCLLWIGLLQRISTQRNFEAQVTRVIAKGTHDEMVTGLQGADETTVGDGTGNLLALTEAPNLMM